MNNKILNIIIIILIIAILGVLGYFVYDTYLRSDKESKNNQNSSYKVEDYISIEKVNLFDTEKINIEKVVFKNLDASIVNEFNDEQNRLINNVHNSYNYWLLVNFEGLSSKDGVIAYSDIWYQMNGNILTIYYDMYYEDAMGECNDIAAINIDLENKKLVTNEELLKLGNSSFNDIAEEHYNKTLKSFENCDDSIRICGIQDKDYNIIKVSQFEEDKAIYIDMIANGLDGAIICYIKDGKIKYDYKRFAIDSLYMGVGKGGCFDYITVDVGYYK